MTCHKNVISRLWRIASGIAEWLHTITGMLHSGYYSHRLLIRAIHLFGGSGWWQPADIFGGIPWHYHILVDAPSEYLYAGCIHTNSMNTMPLYSFACGWHKWNFKISCFQRIGARYNQNSLFIQVFYQFMEMWESSLDLSAVLLADGTNEISKLAAANTLAPATIRIAFLCARLKNGIMPWQCPCVHSSVRASIRPPIPDFSLLCSEISIWCLVYTLSRWHDMSSVSCITIGSLWPSLQPKVCQTHFCNHGLINQDKFFKFDTHVACCILLDISSVFWKKKYFGDYFCAFWISRSFSGFFLHVLGFRFETWYIHAVGGVARQIRVSFQSRHLTYFTAKICQSHLSAFMALKII